MAHDGVGPRGEGPSSGRVGQASSSSASSLPSYSQAMEQATDASSPPSSADDRLQGHVTGKETMATAGMRPSAPRPSYDEQLALISPLQKAPLKPGETWCVVPREWWRLWSAVCAPSSTRQANGGNDDNLEEAEAEAEAALGPIVADDLADVSRGKCMLKRGLEEGIHFEVVPMEAWNHLAQWYGTSGICIAVPVIQHPISKTLRLEFFPPCLVLFTASSSPIHLLTSHYSITQTLGLVKEQASAALREKLPDTYSETLEKSRIRFWRLPLDSNDELAMPSETELQKPGAELLQSSDDEQTLADMQLDQPLERLAVETRPLHGAWNYSAQGIPTSVSPGNINADREPFLSRLQNKDGSAPVPATSSGDAASPSASQPMGRVTRSQTAAERGAEKQRGLTGLYNLGNTCFMNSALQCMSNTKELKDYFVSGVYKSEVNTDNPLGMGGAIAKVFGELLSKIWANGGGAVHPRDFKMVLSRFSPQFIGYAQQDTQELLAFLLDGLHEDLNRIVKKPYIEAPDWEGGGIREMITFAHKQWEIYKMRNDSVIVDLFQGQYRSTLVCPDCEKVSVKFDPFMYLTLPIPNRKTTPRTVHFISFDEQKTLTINLLFKGEASIALLKRKVADIVGIQDASRLVATDYFNREFYRIYSDFDSISEISEADKTFVYELPSLLKTGGLPQDGSSFMIEGVKRLERKKAPPSDKASEAAILPVFTVLHQPNMRSSDTPCHRPFFVSIPADKINDPTYIRASIFDKYAAFAQDAAALQEVSTTIRNGKTSSTPNSQEDWDMVDDGKVLPLDMQGEQQPDTVAEIHDEGASVHIVPDTRMDVDGAPRTASLQSITRQSGDAPMTIFFHLNRTDGAPFTHKSEGFSGKAEELFARSTRLLSGSATSSDADDETMQASDSTSVDADGRPAQWPLVYSGGALICRWDGELRDRVFGGSNDDEWLLGSKTIADPEIEKEQQIGKKAAKSSLNIDDCLNEFTKEERLGESDPWYCPQCKDFKQASKKFDLWKVPDILVVHLKRFSSGRISRDKIDSVIDFPINGLDLTERVEGAKAVKTLSEGEDGDDKLMESIGSLDANDDAVEADAPIYDLYAVDNHYGGLGGGHYTAYAKNPEDEKWYYFDDSSVRPANVEDSKSSAAYLLFYRRRTTRPIGGKSREKVRESINSTQNSDGESESHGDEAERSQGNGASGSSTASAMNGAGLSGNALHDHGGNILSDAFDSFVHARLAHDGDYAMPGSRANIFTDYTKGYDTPEWSIDSPSDESCQVKPSSRSTAESCSDNDGTSVERVDATFDSDEDAQSLASSSDDANADFEEVIRIRRRDVSDSPVSRVPSRISSGGNGTSQLSSILTSTRPVPML